MNQFLANLIPDSNTLNAAFASPKAASSILEAAYSEGSGFVGVFADDEDQPTWARRAARYLDDEFLFGTPGHRKWFSDVETELADGAGECHPNFRYALDFWLEAGQQGVEPYTAQQDYGSCVDASCGEHESVLFGWRARNHAALAARGEQPEEYRHASAWYKYADRGYCSDGWNGSGIATVALRVGCAFRIPYEIGGNSVDFTGDDENERIVARTWCRSGIPGWMRDHTQANHHYADGAITRFDGGVTELRKVFAAGGIIHTSGTRTSGGSKPFSIGRVGPHMQSGVGCDDSEQFRRFCRDVIGVAPRDNDFPVVMNQTWSTMQNQWSGECADEYWPDWWGRKPAGAWVWWASDVIERLSCDYAWLPWVKGFPASTPIPPVPPPPSAHPPITGDIWTENAGQIIRGNLTLELPSAQHRYIVVPAAAGKFRLTPKPEV